MTEILYRKWRPRTFAEVAGQEHVATTLRNALETGRVAHAYLFAGPRGTGKTSTGRLLGKAINCTNRQAGEPCNQCESCQSFLSGRAMDLIELDAASNRGIEEMRNLRDKVAFAPGAGDRKVYLIDEVHMLTEAAFNALLKTLEEPPPHVIFILATTEAHKLPATIASRCQRFDFRRIPLSAAVGRLQTICEGEGITCEPAALELIARSATGSLRDATNLLDQLATSYGNDLTIEHVRSGLGLIGDERALQLARLALAGDLAGGLTLIAAVRDDGLDLRQFQREIIDELRDLLMVKSGLDPREGATVERLQDLRDAVANVGTPQLLTALRAFGEADLKQDPNSTLPLDIALAECALTGTPSAALPERSQPNGPNGSLAPSSRPSTPPHSQTASPSPRKPALSGVEGETGPGDEVSASFSPSPRKERGPVGEVPARAMSAGHPLSPDGEGAGGGVVPPTLGAARQQMRPMYEKARARGFQFGALLNSGCDVVEADENVIVIGFRHPVHAGKAAEKANLDAFAAIATELMGRPIEVRCILAEDVTPWSQRESANRSPLVRAAQEMGARIISQGEAAEPED